MEKEILGVQIWNEETGHGRWHKYFSAKSGQKKIIGVGYDIDRKNVIICYADSEFYEYIRIADGKIVSFDRYSCQHGHYFCPQRPIILADNFNRIRDSLTDETARKLLGSLSESEFKKIQPTDFERKLSKS